MTRSLRLPEFYRPWPARLNPHLGSAREHSKAWARGMGMLDHAGPDGSPVWDEARFDSMDYALMNAYVHPDASTEELALLTDWYVWVFFFDDHFFQAFKRTGDYDGARAHLVRLALFTPLDGAAPSPSNPDERALSDLWPRTVPARSAEWCRRFAASTQNLIQDCLRELSNMKADRVPNPIDHVSENVLAYVRTLQDWMVGDNQWYRQTGRYTRRPMERLLHGPTGPGTSAARIADHPGFTARSVGLP